MVTGKEWVRGQEKPRQEVPRRGHCRADGLTQGSGGKEEKREGLKVPNSECTPESRKTPFMEVLSSLTFGSPSVQNPVSSRHRGWICTSAHGKTRPRMCSSAAAPGESVEQSCPLELCASL